jgi:hypothetical protein
MVGMLQFIARRTGRTLPEIPITQDGKPTEAVFKALAALPLTANPRGKPPEKWPPFDADELFRLIQKELDKQD